MCLSTRSLPDETKFLHVILSGDNLGEPVLSSPMRLLNKGEEVAGMVLMSTGYLCTVDQIRANVSIVSPVSGE